ncbi:hypothetical protein SNEBB_008284 [Seison nebaliae]|nr:hypothetical protein SNEBB_008284 [Seison nebaliae]
MFKIRRKFKDIDNKLSLYSTSDYRNKSVNINEVKIFISSTFTDFHSERELFVNEIGELVERKLELAGIPVTIQPIDMRWGIPQGTDVFDAVSICLNEIQILEEETNGSPFVLVLLGNRYGYQLNNAKVANKLEEKYFVFNTLSITHLEILNSLNKFKNGNENVLIMIRNDKFLEALKVKDDENGNMRKLLMSHDDEYSTMEMIEKKNIILIQEELKTNLQKKYHQQAHRYDVEISDHTNTKRLQLKKLEKFQEIVIDFFYNRISQFYKENMKNFENELNQLYPFTMNDYFKMSGSSTDKQKFQKLQKILYEISRSKYNSRQNFVEKQLGKSSREIRPQQIIESQSGSGLTYTLLALTTHLLRSTRNHTFYYKIYSNNDILPLYYHLYNFLSGKFSDEHYPDQQKYVEKLEQILKTESFDNLNIVIDSHSTKWEKLKEFISLVVGSLKDSSSIFVSTENSVEEFEKFEKIQLPLIEIDDGIKLLEDYFDNCNKKLTKEMIINICSKKIIENIYSIQLPKWTFLLAQLLEKHGEIKTLNNLISAIPASYDELLMYSIDYKIKSNKLSKLTKKILHYLTALFPYGMTEQHLKEILQEDFCKDFENESNLNDIMKHVEFDSLQFYITTKRTLKDVVKYEMIYMRNQSDYQYQLCSTNIFKCLNTYFELTDHNRKMINGTILRYFSKKIQEENTLKLFHYLFISIQQSKSWKEIYLMTKFNRLSLLNYPPYEWRTIFNQQRCTSYVIKDDTIIKYCKGCLTKVNPKLPMILPNNQICFVCHNYFHIGSQCNAALCAQHSIQFNLRQNACFLCQQLITNEKDTTLSRKICNDCSVHNKRRCCITNVLNMHEFRSFFLFGHI